MRYLIAMLVWVSFSTHANFDLYGPTVVEAAETVGVDPVLLLAMVHKESKFKNVKAAAGGSAEGLLQITDRTWQHLLYRYANDYDIPLDADKYNPRYNAIMAAEYVKENVVGLKNLLKRDPTAGEIYFAHLLGLSGAMKLLSADLNDKAHKVVAYAYVRNGPLFKTASGKYRTVRQFRDYHNWRFNKLINQYSAEYERVLLASN